MSEYKWTNEEVTLLYQRIIALDNEQLSLRSFLKEKNIFKRLDKVQSDHVPLSKFNALKKTVKDLANSPVEIVQFPVKPRRKLFPWKFIRRR